MNGRAGSHVKQLGLDYMSSKVPSEGHCPDFKGERE